jgi:hypothetical protein
VHYLLTLCNATDDELLELKGGAVPNPIAGLQSEHSHSQKGKAPPTNGSRSENTNNRHHNKSHSDENPPNPSSKTKKNSTRRSGLKELPKMFHNVIESMNSREVEFIFFFFF